MSHVERVIPLDRIHENERVKKHVRKIVRIPGLYNSRGVSAYPDELVVEIVLEYHDPKLTGSYEDLAREHGIGAVLVRNWCQGITRRPCWLKAMKILEERAAREKREK